MWTVAGVLETAPDNVDQSAILCLERFVRELRTHESTRRARHLGGAVVSEVLVLRSA